MAINNDEKNLIIGLGVLAIAYFGVIKPVTNKLGLTESDKARRVREAIEEANNNQGWDPRFYKTIKKSQRILAATSAKHYASQIHAAWGSFDDDEQKIYAVFRALKSQAQLSQVVEMYGSLYKQDLLTRLKSPWSYFKGGSDGLSDKEFSVIADMVQKLPPTTL